MRILKITCVFILISLASFAEDGYKLWLRYEPVTNQSQLSHYKDCIKAWKVEGNSATFQAIRKELDMGLTGMLGISNSPQNTIDNLYTLLVGTPSSSAIIKSTLSEEELGSLGEEGYIVKSVKISNRDVIIISGNSDVSAFYGTFHFLRLIQTNKDLKSLNLKSVPKVGIRVLNHWDNLDRTVERGYAGFSIWDWHKLPHFLDPRYHDYARANASIGINGTVLTNVNANALILTPDFIEKVKAMADLFRPYGIKVYLTARFSAPVEIGGLETADPLDPAVKSWWAGKINEIYESIPDFGGFLVKANSEGQPGPQNYNRDHADGANMLAEALKPHGGNVMWRAFVYQSEDTEDRHKQASNQFEPLDGKFMDNVLVQVKNGAIDFQPREPFHPMFGKMPKTPLMMEFQITQEYLGQATNLVYMGPLYEEVLDSDTYAKGQGSTVAKVIDGSLHDYSVTGMAGVSNIGNDRNWTGHTFGQSNWYAFGRLAWDHELNSSDIADEWIGMTFSNEPEVHGIIKEIMMSSWGILVNYMTPLGLHHIMGTGHHYGPAPWVKELGRPEWNPAYYHQAAEDGIGFDRTASGSNATSQYFPEVEEKFSSLDKIPEKFLLWFHHLSWDHKLENGKTLWVEMVERYYQGVESVKNMQKEWDKLEGKIDDGRFQHVKMLLKIQYDEAVWWRNACVLYFQQFSKRPIPDHLEKPDKTLEYYQSLRFRYAPGIRPRW